MLRLVAGGVFVAHGAGRLSRKGRAWPMTLIGVLELIGGALLLLGLVTFFAALLVSTAVLLLVLLGSREPDELVLLLLAVPFALTATGPGAWSLDEAVEFGWVGVLPALVQLGAAWIVATAGAIAAGREEEEEGTHHGAATGPA